MSADSDRILATAVRVLKSEAEAVDDLARRLDASFPRAVEIAASCTGKIAVAGMGKSGIICKKIAATLSSTGSPAIFLHAAEAMHGDLGLLGLHDVVLALSKSGETEEILQILNVAKRLGLPVIAMSGNPASTLARHADVNLDVSVPEEACRGPCPDHKHNRNSRHGRRACDRPHGKEGVPCGGLRFRAPGGRHREEAPQG